MEGNDTRIVENTPKKKWIDGKKGRKRDGSLPGRRKTIACRRLSGARGHEKNERGNVHNGRVKFGTELYKKEGEGKREPPVCGTGSNVSLGQPAPSNARKERSHSFSGLPPNEIGEKGTKGKS